TRDVALPSWGAGVDGTLLCGRRGAPIRPETVPPDRRPARRGRRPLRGPAHDPRAGAREAHGGTDGGRTRPGRAPRPAGAPALAPGPGTRVAGCAAHPGAPSPDVADNYLYSPPVGATPAHQDA